MHALAFHRLSNWRISDYSPISSVNSLIRFSKFRWKMKCSSQKCLIKTEKEMRRGEWEKTDCGDWLGFYSLSLPNSSKIKSRVTRSLPAWIWNKKWINMVAPNENDFILFVSKEFRFVGRQTTVAALHHNHICVDRNERKKELFHFNCTLQHMLTHATNHTVK